MNWHWYLNYKSHLLGITPRVMCAYLEAHGWKYVEPHGEFGKVYALDENGTELVVPMSQQLGDYGQVLNEIIEVLSKVEERDGLAILRDLSMFDWDLVRLRVPVASSDGSIPISLGVTLVEQSRNMLLAAACSTLRSQSAFRLGANKEAADYLKKVNLGQTGQGSFIVNLLSPVPHAPGPQANLPYGLFGEPYERRVTRKLISGLQAAREAVDLTMQGSGIGVFENRINEGVNANLCDAVEKMLSSEGIDEHIVGTEPGLDVSVAWALMHPYPGGKAQVHFNPQDIPALKEASRALKDRRELPNERIKGYVTLLGRRQLSREGRVTIEAEIDGARHPVRVVGFTDSDYGRLVEAHGNRKSISLEGDLRHEGRGWVLYNPHNLNE